MSNQLLKDIMIVSPMLALFVMSLFPILMKVFKGNREPNPYATLFLAFIGLSLAVGLTALYGGTTRATAFSGAIVLDGVSVWTSYLIYLITAVSLMLSFDHVAVRGKLFAEYVFLVLNAAIGMVIVLMSNDLIVTFIGIEMMSLCLYILIAMSKEEVLAKEAAFKYFVLGSFASAIFLYGVAFLYGTVGSTHLPEINEAVTMLVSTNRMFVLGLGLLILGFAFKVSIFPLHAWTPDVYTGAPTPITAFMATAVKAATFVAILRLFHSQGFSDAPKLQSVLEWMAVLTMTAGNVAAVMQNNFKRMLAYSSVAHSGYLMIGVIAAGFGNNYDSGATSVVFYLFSYSLMTLGTFALGALFEKYENTNFEIDGLRGLASKYPILCLSLTILMLSLAGIPPTLGFFGKFFLFTSAIEQDLYWLVFWGVINSVISVYYYLRPVVMMYMSNDEPAEVMTSHLMTRMTVIFTAVLIVVFGIASSPILKAVKQSVRQSVARIAQ